MRGSFNNNDIDNNYDVDGSDNDGGHIGRLAGWPLLASRIALAYGGNSI